LRLIGAWHGRVRFLPPALHRQSLQWLSGTAAPKAPPARPLINLPPPGRLRVVAYVWTPLFSIWARFMAAKRGGGVEEFSNLVVLRHRRALHTDRQQDRSSWLSKGERGRLHRAPPRRYNPRRLYVPSEYRSGIAVASVKRGPRSVHF
jgi:hypothetical protein